MRRLTLAAAVVLAFAAMAAAQPVATCSVANDPQERQWTLERPSSGAPDAPWRVVFKGRALSQPQTELRVPGAQPLITPEAVTLSFNSANDGLSIEWRAKAGPSTIDIYVNFGLEVNVDADLDPAVEHLNTEGSLPVTCTLGPPTLAPRGVASFGEAGSDLVGTSSTPGPPSLALTQDASFGEASTSGTSDTPGTPGTPGTSGTSGTPGTPGTSGASGTSGTSGTPGTSGASGTLGTLPSTEWVIGAGAGWGIRLFQSKGDRWYAIQTVSWGRALTGDLGPGALRGRFVWAIEAMPLFAQAHPTHVYGVGVAPVLWRWNFVPRPGWSAFGEIAMGGLWSSAPVPEKTQRANFTAHWGAGVRLHRSSGRSVVLAYRLQHISNGNQLSTNPGVNSHVIFAGWSVRR